MRRRQRRIVLEAQRVYATNDPMKWARLAFVLDVRRPLTVRERRVCIRRLVRGFRKFGFNVRYATTKITEAIVEVFERATPYAPPVPASAWNPVPIGTHTIVDGGFKTGGVGVDTALHLTNNRERDKL